MPRFDKTGPGGQGSQTGRGLGKCNPKKENNSKQEMSDERHYGLGRKKSGGLRRWLGLGKNKSQQSGSGRNNA